MSDPFVHFAAGFVVGGIAGKGIFSSYGYKNRFFDIAIVSGVASVALDFDHLPLLEQAGWSYVRLVNEIGSYVNEYSFHFEMLWVVFALMCVLFFIWVGAKMCELEHIYTITRWIYCYLATITFVLNLHILMDEVFQCFLWPISRCGYGS